MWAHKHGPHFSDNQVGKQVSKGKGRENAVEGAVNRDVSTQLSSVLKKGNTLPSTTWLLSIVVIIVVLMVGVVGIYLSYNNDEKDRTQTTIEDHASALLNTVELLHTGSMSHGADIDSAVAIFDRFLGDIPTIRPDELIGGLSVSAGISSHAVDLTPFFKERVATSLITASVSAIIVISLIHFLFSRPLGQITRAMDNVVKGNNIGRLPNRAFAKEIGQLLKVTFKLEHFATANLAEIELQKSALDLHAIVSITDAERNITYVNDKFCEITGFDRPELLGHNHRIIRSHGHSPEFYENMRNTLSAGQVWSGVIKNRNKEGSDYWVESTIVPQLDKNGIPVRYISVQTDITRVKIYELEMEQLLLEAFEVRERMEEQAAHLVAMSETQAEDKEELARAASTSDNRAAEEQVLSQLLKITIGANDRKTDDMGFFLERSLEVLLNSP